MDIETSLVVLVKAIEVLELRAEALADLVREVDDCVMLPSWHIRAGKLLGGQAGEETNQ